MLDLHDAGSNGPSQAAVSGLDAVADADETGFIVADPQHVYVTGFFGGDRMASALACARPDLVTVIAPVAGLRADRASADDPSVVDDETSASAQGVSVVTFYGEDDTVAPPTGAMTIRGGATTSPPPSRPGPTSTSARRR